VPMKTAWMWTAAAGLVVVAFLAVTPGPLAFTARVGQPAPEITGGPWINSEPLSMEKLRGRVVAVEFWTFG
jgi:ABC-type nitrate/sulfonate/bicarbonate transport system substrate-binding protein